MTERISQQVPMACYGLEQRPSNVLCGACDVKEACAALMGNRLNNVAAADAVFNLVPPALAEVPWTLDDEFKHAYDECYRIIFKDFEPDSLYKREGLRQQVTAAAAQAGCPVKLFLLTVMWGHRLKNPGRFYCTMLSGDAALRRVAAYRAEVEEQYGTFHESTLAEYSADSSMRSNSKKLSDAELIAGSWIVGYKTRRGGDPMAPFLELNEALLPDIWLASEVLYHAFLVKWREVGGGTAAQRLQRARVAKLVGEIKRRPKQALALFKAREAVMPSVIKKVLEQRGFNPSAFRVSSTKTWTSTIDFWTKIGLAVQHHWCREYLKGDQHKALRHLVSAA